MRILILGPNVYQFWRQFVWGVLLRDMAHFKLLLDNPSMHKGDLGVYEVCSNIQYPLKTIKGSSFPLISRAELPAYGCIEE